MPADSKARLITSSVALRGRLTPASNWYNVTIPIPADFARCCWLQPRRPRAALHWAAVITLKSMTQAPDSFKSVRNPLTPLLLCVISTYMLVLHGDGRNAHAIDNVGWPAALAHWRLGRAHRHGER